MTIKKKLSIVLIPVALVIAAVAVWLARRDEALFSKQDVGEVSWLAGDYRLIADGELETAVVSMVLTDKNDSKKRATAYLLVDLKTHSSQRLFKGFGPVRGRVLGTMHPSGHAIMGVGSAHQGQILRLEEELRVRLLKKPRRWGIELDVEWNARAEKFFYNATANTLTPFSSSAGANIVYAWRWKPGSDCLIVSEASTIAGVEQSCLVDAQGDVTARLPAPAGLNVGRFGYFEVNKKIFRGERPNAIPSIVFVPWEETAPITIEAPEGHNIIGWTPDARYILLAPKAEDYLLAYDPYPDMIAGRPMEALLGFDEVGGNDSAVLKDNLALILWDRETDEQINMLDLTLSTPKGAQSYVDNGISLYLTTRGVLTFIRTGPDNTLRELSYYSLANREWQTIDLAVKEPKAWMEVASVSPDERAFLIRTPFHGLFPASQSSGLITERQLVLVEPDGGKAKPLPLSVDGWAPQHMRFKLMQDGTILAVEGDSLLRYDPKTDEKDIIVEDLFAEWKKLGEEPSHAGPRKGQDT